MPNSSYIADSGNNRIRRVGPDGIITTFAGTGMAGFSGDGGLAIQARLSFPTGLAVDANGNIYIVSNGRIRRVGPDGIITTFAGTGNPGFSGDGGLATQATLSLNKVAVDVKGFVYIADSGNNRIRRVGPDGIITTFAGTGNVGHLRGGFGGDGGPATQALLHSPTGVAIDASENIYIADSENHRIRRVGPDGIITTFAGTGTRSGPPPDFFSGDGGPAARASLNLPWDVAVDAGGNVYIAEYGASHIRRVRPDGTITTIAGVSRFVGSSYSMFSGDGGPATQADLQFPRGVTVDANGNVYIADTDNHRVRRVTGLGTSGASINMSASLLKFDTTKVGETSQKTFIISNAGSGNLGIREMTIAEADTGQFKVSPTTATIAPGDSQIVTVTFIPTSVGSKSASLSLVHNADRGLSTIALSGRGVAQTGPGIITTFAGTGTAGFSGDRGPAAQAQLNNPSGVSVDVNGSVYFADRDNHRICRVGADGVITPFAGTGTAGFSGDGGPAAQAALSSPDGIAVDANENIYITDRDNHRIRRVGPDGIITTLAGTGMAGFSGDGGPAVQASLNFPSGIALDAKGNVYIADHDNHRVRRVGSDGIILTVAGSGPTGFGRGDFSGDGRLATQARLNNPSGVAVDEKGIVYITDTSNHRIRLIGPDSIIATFAGTGTSGFSGDGGPASQARLSSPRGVAVDAKGDVYIADQGNHRIRWRGPDGIIKTIAGGGLSGDGGPATLASLNNPSGVTVDTKGFIYIADSNNHRIRRVETVSRTGVPLPSSDFNEDRKVDFVDFFLFANAFGKKAIGDNFRYDLDGNGEIDFNDFFLFADSFGKKI